MRYWIIPNPENNFTFECVKAPKIDHRKWPCINLILSHLRWSICRQLSRLSNIKLFSGFGVIWVAASLSGLEVDISAKSAVLINADSGVCLFAKDAEKIAYPASTTKVAVVLYVLEKGEDLRRMAAVSGEALRARPIKDRFALPAYWIDTDGSTMMGIKKGEVLSLEALLYGMMLVSGNDAANVVAEAVGGTVPGFIGLLNEYLKEIGCKATQFQNPHGLHHPDHWTTAMDLARIARRAFQHETFRKIVSSLSYSVPKSNKQEERELITTNPLIKPKSRYYHLKVIGGKSGNTKMAQKTMVVAAEHEGRRLIAVVLGCETSEERFGDIRRLFDAAFAEKKTSRRIMGPEHTFVHAVEHAKGSCRASVASPVQIEYFPSEEPKCKAALHWALPSLPIHKGDKVGEVVIQDMEGRKLQVANLVALEEVRSTFWYSIQRWFSRWF